MVNKNTKAIINANGTEIAVLSSGNENDYISLTDIARYKSDEPNAVIQNWMRNKDTIEFLGLWEQLNNPNFKPIEFEGFKNKAGANSFVLSPQKWIPIQMQSALFQNLGDMEAHSRIKILPLSSHHGYLLNSSYTSLKTINA